MIAGSYHRCGSVKYRGIRKTRIVVALPIIGQGCVRIVGLVYSIFRILVRLGCFVQSVSQSIWKINLEGCSLSKVRSPNVCRRCNGTLRSGKKSKVDGSIHSYCPSCGWSSKPRIKKVPRSKAVGLEAKK